MNNSRHAAAVADLLLSVDAVRLTPQAPITLKSGIISPIYIDNRKLPFYPAAWKRVLAAFTQSIAEHQLVFDVIAGIESAGIPHSAALGYLLNTPSVFVRKAPKDHGTKKRIEGGDVASRNVLLIEDLVTTGGSSLDGVVALRDAGAMVADCLAIVRYDLPESAKAFADAKVRLHTLTTLPEILAAAERTGVVTQSQAAAVKDFLNDPHGWGSKQGV